MGSAPSDFGRFLYLVNGSYGIANATSNKISGKPCHCGAANCKKFLPR